MASTDPAPKEVCLGLLTGISYISGVDYYKTINERYTKQAGTKWVMPPNPLMVLVSVDCDSYAFELTKKNWAQVSYLLMKGVKRLVDAGSTFLCIASNTGHICVPQIHETYPDMPFLHIADCTAKAIKKKGLNRVGLIGTEATMREMYLRSQLEKHGIEVIVPTDDKVLYQIFQFIMLELGQGVFTETTRGFFLQVIEQLRVDHGIRGIILGCTEIELLVRDGDLPTDVQRFPSAELHIEAITDVLLGKVDISSFLP